MRVESSDGQALKKKKKKEGKDLQMRVSISWMKRAEKEAAGFLFLRSCLFVAAPSVSYTNFSVVSTFQPPFSVALLKLVSTRHQTVQRNTLLSTRTHGKCTISVRRVLFSDTPVDDE